MDNITVEATERMNWKRCPRMWWYSSRNGLYLEPVRPRAYFAVGTAVHEALAKWTQYPDGDLEVFYMQAAAEQVEAIKEHYLSVVGCGMSDTELADHYEQLEVGQHVMRAYQEHYKQPLPEGFRLIANEQECVIPIEIGGHSLKIKLDGLAADEDNYVYVIERKTYSRKPRPIDLEMNEQFLTYMFGAQKLGLGPVGGLLYDGIMKRKPTARTPAADLFYRTTITKNSHQLAEFEQLLITDICKMYGDSLRYSAGSVIATTVPWNGCSDCAFQAPCLARSRGEDEDYLLRNEYTSRSN